MTHLTTDQLAHLVEAGSSDRDDAHDALRAHVRGCASCGARLAVLVEVMKVASAAPAPDHALTDAIVSAAARSSAITVRPNPSRVALVAAVGVCALLVIALAAQGWLRVASPSSGPARLVLEAVGDDGARRALLDGDRLPAGAGLAVGVLVVRPLDAPLAAFAIEPDGTTTRLYPDDDAGCRAPAASGLQRGQRVAVPRGPRAFDVVLVAAPACAGDLSAPLDRVHVER